MKTIALFLALTSSSALAADTYQCELILASANLPNGGITWKFATGTSEESHGGAPKIFHEGENELQILANAQWLGISWSKGTKKIAEGVFVLGSLDKTEQRVAVLYDPSDSGDQVSLGCSRESKVP